MKCIRRLVLLGFSFCLMACQKESVIQLSEENQAKLTNKITVERNPALESLAEESEEIIESDLANSDELEDESSQTIGYPDLDQIEQTDALEAPLSAYLPYYPYQLKVFSNGSASFTSYVDYFDDSLASMQVQFIHDKQTDICLINWGDGSLQQAETFQDVTPLLNYMTYAGNGQNVNFIHLMEPLQKGQSWQNPDGSQSEITAIYSQIILANQPYQEVIQVEQKQGDQVILERFYAKDEGLIAYYDPISSDYWQITSNLRDVMLSQSIAVYQPVNEQDQLVREVQADLFWQTNFNLEASFQELFRNQSWISDEIVVQDISLDQETVYLDFSPGIVAVMNEHPAGENAVIASIVKTIGDYLNRDQVRLTVDGSGLLPTYIEYPAMGIYHTDLRQFQINNPITDSANQEFTSTDELIEGTLDSETSE